MAVERNEDLLRKELSRPRPQVDVVKSLVQRTLASRRKAVLDGDRPEDLLDKYLHLKKPILYDNSVCLCVFVWKWGGGQENVCIEDVVLS